MKGRSNKPKSARSIKEERRLKKARKEGMQGSSVISTEIPTTHQQSS